MSWQAGGGRAESLCSICGSQVTSGQGKDERTRSSTSPRVTSATRAHASCAAKVIACFSIKAENDTSNYEANLVNNENQIK